MKTYVQPSVLYTQINAISILMGSGNPGTKPGVDDSGTGSSDKIARRLYV